MLPLLLTNCQQQTADKSSTAYLNMNDTAHATVNVGI